MWQRFKSTRFFAIIRNKYVIATLVFAVWICFFNNNNLIDLGHALVKLTRNKAQINYYKEQIHQTEGQLRQLQSNKDSLERFAREKYYFQQDNQDVFIVRPAESNREELLP